MQYSIALTTMLAMAPLVSSHMIMKSPVPYGSPNNSPLAPDGSDFPCKVGAGGSGSYEVTSMNEWEVGSTQQLTFTGSATHGGGSCQIAVTTDKEPTKESKFKVIYSIEGGCPTTGAGNNGELGAFDFEVPKELPNGEATVAWTWFNKIGNREFYMNCGPITVSGGSDDTAAFDSLPDMAVANIQGQGDCTTTEASDYTFEDPGQYTTRVGTGPFVGLCGGAASEGGGSDGGSGSGGGSGGGSGQPEQQEPPASGAPTPAPDGGSGGGSDGGSPAPVTSTVNTLITVTAPAGQAPQQTPAGGGESPAAPAPETPDTEAPAAGGGGGGGGCTEGEIVCSPDGSQFGLCNGGNAVMQAVAAGTTCQGGKIAKRGFLHRNQRFTLF